MPSKRKVLFIKINGLLIGQKKKKSSDICFKGASSDLGPILFTKPQLLNSKKGI